MMSQVQSAMYDDVINNSTNEVAAEPVDDCRLYCFAPPINQTVMSLCGLMHEMLRHVPGMHSEVTVYTWVR